MTNVGQLMRRTTASGFKVVVVLSVTRETYPRVRFCVWSENSRRWSKPQTAELATLAPLDETPVTAHERATVRHATENLEKARGEVRYPGGATMAWTADHRIPAPPTPLEGITRLASITTPAITPAKLQRLNAAISDFTSARKRR